MRLSASLGVDASERAKKHWALLRVGWSRLLREHRITVLGMTETQVIAC